MSPTPLPKDLLSVHERLNNDLQYFMDHAPLYIKDKVTGDLTVFKMNRAQRYIHSRLEAQLKRRGFVRACILKGRQQGCSTYVAARFYHHTTRRRGVSTFIISHEGGATDHLLGMVRIFQEHINPVLRPEEGQSNTRTIEFPGVVGRYTAATAGNENAGRSRTAQRFHGSEAAYWENADAIQDSALSAIARVAGTEVILESTANGPVGMFYRKCMDALRGIGDYELIFVPWFWQDEYEAEYDPKMEPTLSEENYLKAHLSEYPRTQALRKLAWRRIVTRDLMTGDNLASGEAKFCQIYPATPAEAFQSTGVGLIRPEAIMAARKSNITDEGAPLVLGVDPAGDSEDSDRTVIAARRGRHLEKIFKYTRMRQMELVGILAKLINELRPDQVFIDRGYGEGVIDRLHELGFRRQVIGVAFNERSLNPDIYLNKRSEILIEAAKWLNAGDVRIPDDDELHADLACMPLDQETSNGLKYLLSKRELRKILGRSPDIYDAIGLTFAYPVSRAKMGAVGSGKNGEGGWTKKSSEKGPLTSVTRFKGRR